MKIKKIVVTDRPENCYDCTFWEQKYDNNLDFINYCMITEENIDDAISNLNLSSTCILKEEKKSGKPSGITNNSGG